jgi:hypothetical protein
MGADFVARVNNHTRLFGKGFDRVARDEPRGFQPVLVEQLQQAAIAGTEPSKKAESEPFKPLTVDEVQKRLTQPNVYVYDGNRDELYLEGHVPGAVHLDPAFEPGAHLLLHMGIPVEVLDPDTAREALELREEGAKR